MDPSDSKAADFERRASRRASRRISVNIGGDGVGDDDLDVEALAIADGFSPTMQDVAHEAAVPSMSGTPPASSAQLPRTSTAERPSSIAKPPLPADDATAHPDETNGGLDESALTRQSSATASTDGPRLREESIYGGPSGPSFPYQMYPQNVRVARTLSSTTASTTPPSEEPSYTGPRGPTHPYGMYPQNTVAGSSAIPMADIPLGFHGMADNYQRQIGPDGEEIGEMIGPNGHTEELPPYSRYPDEAYARKDVGAQPPQPAAASESATAPPAPAPAASPTPGSAPAPASAPIQPISGAGGIGLAARNPEFDSASDLDSPRSRHSSRSFTDSEASQHDINTAARAVSEKPKPMKKWQLYARRRLWGIVPYWAIGLLITAILLMGVIMGTVIGTFYANHKKPPRRQDFDPDEAPAVTVTVDATPIPTPTDLPALPTGVFSLPLMLNKSPSSCFSDTTQAQAWSCSVAYFGSAMTVNIQNLPPKQGLPEYSISINCNTSNLITNNVWWYGEQPPVIPKPSPLEMVNDTFDQTRGPAWFKMMPYNKTVVIHENLLSLPTAAPSVSTARAPRRIRRRGPAFGDYHRKGLAQAGDKPWVCTWPDTVLEVFIYPNQNTSLWRFGASSSSSSPGPTPFPSPGSNPSPPGVGGPSPTPTSGPSEGGGTASPTSSGAPSYSPWNLPPPPPPYPRVLKVEERRMARSRLATCVQYELKPDGEGRVTSRPIVDQNGKRVEMTIMEEEPGPPIGPPPGMEERDLLESRMFTARDNTDLSDCGCLWMVT